MLRSLVIGRIGSAGETAVVDEAKKRFAAHCGGSSELPADLRSAVSNCAFSVSSLGVCDSVAVSQFQRCRREKLRLMTLFSLALFAIQPEISHDVDLWKVGMYQ